MGVGMGAVGSEGAPTAEHCIDPYRPRLKRGALDDTQALGSFREMARLKQEHLDELRRLHDQSVAILDGVGQVEPEFTSSVGRWKLIFATALSSQNLRGTRMAARDLRGMLKALKPKDRRQVLEYVKSTTGQALEEEVSKDAVKARQILARGRIRNDTEYYLLRGRLDEIEGEPELADEERDLQRLIDGYRH